MAKPEPYHRRIAPKLASGVSRLTTAGGLPPHIKRGLQMIAQSRGESVSWVIEQIIYQHFGFRVPTYMGTRSASEIDPTAYKRIIVRTKEPRSALSSGAVRQRLNEHAAKLVGAAANG